MAVLHSSSYFGQFVRGAIIDVQALKQVSVEANPAFLSQSNMAARITRFLEFSKF